MTDRFDENVLIHAIHQFAREGESASLQALARAWQEHEPASLAAHAALALGLLLDGDTAQALERVQRLIDSGSPHALVWYVRARLHLLAGQTDEALTCLEQSLMLAPREAEALRVLATVHLEAQRTAQAIGVLRRLDESGQARADDLTLLAELLMYAEPQEPGQIRALLSRARALDVTCSACWAVEGDLLVRLGQLDEAKRALDHALVLNPGNAAFVHRRAIVALAAHDPGDAMRLARRALTLMPQNPATLVTLVDAFLMDHQLDQAVQALENHPQHHEHEDIWVRRIQMLAHARRHDEAGQVLDRPPKGVGPVQLESLRAWHAQLQGQTGAAVQAWEKLYALLHPSPEMPVLAATNLSEALAFMRFAPAVAARGHRVQLCTADADMTLFRLMEGVTQVHAASTCRLPLYPVHCLPVLAGYRDGDALFERPYVRCASAGFPRMKQRPGERNMPTVLLSLGGTPPPYLLDALGERFAAWGWHVLLLQPIRRWTDWLLPVSSEVVEVQRLDELCDLTRSVEHVVTLDSVVAHLRGATGLPQDVLLPPVHDPVWGQGESSAWYPHARLHRCGTNGRWEAALAELDRLYAPGGVQQATLS